MEWKETQYKTTLVGQGVEVSAYVSLDRGHWFIATYVEGVWVYPTNNLTVRPFFSAKEACSAAEEWVRARMDWEITRCQRNKRALDAPQS